MRSKSQKAKAKKVKAQQFKSKELRLKNGADLCPADDFQDQHLFPVEIVLLIFEALRDMGGVVANLRLVSRSFDQLLTPLLFEHFYFNKTKLAPNINAIIKEWYKGTEAFFPWKFGHATFGKPHLTESSCKVPDDALRMLDNVVRWTRHIKIHATCIDKVKRRHLAKLTHSKHVT